MKIKAKNTYYNLPRKKQLRIIQTAAKEFAEQGYKRASLNTIIKNLGIAKGSLYQYFENKEAILLAIAEMHMQNLISEENMIFKGLPKTEIVLRKLLWRWIWQLWTEEN